MRHGPPCSAGRRARSACLPQFTRVCHAWWPVAAPPPPPCCATRTASAGEVLLGSLGRRRGSRRGPRTAAAHVCKLPRALDVPDGAGPSARPRMELRHEEARQAAAELVLKTEHWPGTNLCSPCEARGAGALRSEPQAYSVKTDDKTFLAERAQRVTPVCRAA